VFGASPAKGQQLEDHYFGSIPERIYAFMRDLRIRRLINSVFLYAQGIMKVAPSQFECAPIFEDVKILLFDHKHFDDGYHGSGITQA
jgi:glutamine synthetase